MSTTTPPAVNTKPKTIGEKLSLAASVLKGGGATAEQFSALEAEHTNATAEITRLTGELAEAKTKAEQATTLANERGTKITELTETVSKITGERDEAITARDGFKLQVDGLPAKISAGVSEKCAELGFDLSKMPKATEVHKAGELATEADYAKAISAEKDPEKKKQLFIAMELKFNAAASPHLTAEQRKAAQK